MINKKNSGVSSARNIGLERARGKYIYFCDPDDILNSNLFTQAEIQDINSALGIILNDEKLSENEKGNLLENSWKINHKFKPPTPEEFLTEDWIGSQAQDIYPHCRKVFLDYFNPLINKNTILLYAPVGFG